MARRGSVSVQVTRHQSPVSSGELIILLAFTSRCPRIVGVPCNRDRGTRTTVRQYRDARRSISWTSEVVPISLRHGRNTGDVCSQQRGPRWVGLRGFIGTEIQADLYNSSLEISLVSDDSPQGILRLDCVGVVGTRSKWSGGRISKIRRLARFGTGSKRDSLAINGQLYAGRNPKSTSPCH